MKCQGSFLCDIGVVQSKPTPKQKPRVVWAEVDIQLDKDTVEAKWGEDMAILAFSTQRRRRGSLGKDESLVYLVDRVTPSKKRVVFEAHKMDILGQTIQGQPVLVSVRMNEGTKTAVARLRLPIQDLRPSLAGKLLMTGPEMVEISFIPLNLSLGFAEGSATEDPAESPETPAKKAPKKKAAKKKGS